MKNNDQNCDRCKKLETSRMSIFNTQMLCTPCLETEKSHPIYSIAREIESIHVRLGNLNYEGLGLPADYESWAKTHQKRSIKN